VEFSQKSFIFINQANNNFFSVKSMIQAYSPFSPESRNIATHQSKIKKIY
jgi:hypothetical protein